MTRRKRFRRTELRLKGVEQLVKAKSVPAQAEALPGLAALLAKAGKMENLNPFSVMDLIVKEVQRIDKENPTGPDEETDPRIVKLLDLGTKIIREMDPIIRENARNDPQALAEWDDIMQGLYEADKEEAAKSDS
jgi:hypothetical protein